MPTANPRTSMAQLSNIWTNPYGGAPQNEINDWASSLETAGARDARIMDEIAMRDQILRRATLENNAIDPARKAMDVAGVEDYATGRWNSPQGYNTEQAANERWASKWKREAPQREYEKDVWDVRSPYGQNRAAILALQQAGNLDLQSLKNVGASDVAGVKGSNDILSRIIQGSFSAANERERELGRIYGAGASMGKDPNAMAQGYTNAPRPAKAIPWAEILSYAAETKQRVNDVVRDLVGQGYDIEK